MTRRINCVFLLFIFTPFIFEEPVFAQCFRIEGNSNADRPVERIDKVVCIDNFSRDYTLQSDGGGRYNGWSISGNCSRDLDGNLENSSYEEKKSFIAMPLGDLVNQHKIVCNQFFDAYE